jgi:serine/threonine protein kinase
MLKQLKRYPHRHIVTHLFTWTQEESFYMLFPKAWGSLQKYMKEQPSHDPSSAISPASSFIRIPPDSSRKRPLLDANFVTWLLRQLLGLAEAVDHIHHLVGEAVQVPTALNIPGGSTSATRATGFHHDIKPGNILVFIDGEDHYGTFKIGDFGSGRLQTFRSGTQRSPFDNRSLGTPTYEGPDVYLLGTASRPYDIWSLGCVYLEILLWCFSPGPGGAEDFATERGAPMPDQPNYSSDEYWCRSVGQGSSTKNASLKEAVKRRIRDLEDNHCKGRRAFEKLMTLVKRMFDIEAKRRITAPQLKGDVQAILKQALADLDSDKDCYIRAADSDALPFDELPESSVPIPRTPTTVPTRRPSLNFGAQLSPLDAQSPVDPNRRRSDSFGQAQVASVTSNAGDHLSQSNAVQDDDLPDPLQGGPLQANQQGFVRSWADNANDDHGPMLQIPQPP